MDEGLICVNLYNVNRKCRPISRRPASTVATYQPATVVSESTVNTLEVVVLLVVNTTTGASNTQVTAIL